MKKEIEKRLMLDLLIMAETSKQYLKGEQWAVNAIATARMILGQVNPESKAALQRPFDIRPVEKLGKTK